MPVGMLNDMQIRPTEHRRRPVTWWMTNTGSEDWISRGGAAHVDQTAHVAALGIAAMVMAAL
ncbi:hypothetical protein [Streptomyces scopuliridis]|uniref:hypothetical protein n=1 Tax=Streptomyces scopuliridis TaxID=452529 RepID=UPI0036BB8B5D